MAGQRGKSIYGTAAWKALRLAALVDAGWRCARCHRYGTEARHLVPLASGGPELPDLSGVEILCRRCHFERHGARQRAPWDALLARVHADTNSG